VVKSVTNVTVFNYTHVKGLVLCFSGDLLIIFVYKVFLEFPHTEFLQRYFFPSVLLGYVSDLRDIQPNS